MRPGYRDVLSSVTRTTLVICNPPNVSTRDNRN